MLSAAVVVAAAIFRDSKLKGLVPRLDLTPVLAQAEEDQMNDQEQQQAALEMEAQQVEQPHLLLLEHMPQAEQEEELHRSRQRPGAYDGEGVIPDSMLLVCSPWGSLVIQRAVGVVRMQCKEWPHACCHCKLGQDCGWSPGTGLIANFPYAAELHTRMQGKHCKECVNRQHARLVVRGAWGCCKQCCVLLALMQA